MRDRTVKSILTVKRILALGLMAVFFSPIVSAHTISIGSFNAGTPGSVTLVMGTYSHGTGLTQGSMQLISGPSGVPSATVAMGPLLTTKPTGLVDGVNNFYADANGGSTPYGSIAADSYNQATNTVGLGPVVNWQGATFTGLTAGTYTYQLTGMTLVNWNNVNSFDANWTGTLVIPDFSVNVPEPSILALLGIGLAGIGFAGRRRSKKAQA